MLAIVVAGVMAGSFFLPWLEVFGQQIGPQIILDGDIIPLADLPWRGWLFLASFALAALGAVLVVVRRPAGVVLVVAGGIPFGLIAERVLGVQGQMQDLGLPLPQTADASQAIDFMRDFMAIGLPVYTVSAALLVVIGLMRVVRGR